MALEFVNVELMDSAIYWPVCQRVIYAENVEEVKSGEHDGFLYVHDDVPHDDDDLEALENGIN